MLNQIDGKRDRRVLELDLSPPSLITYPLSYHHTHGPTRDWNWMMKIDSVCFVSFILDISLGNNLIVLIYGYMDYVKLSLCGPINVVALTLKLTAQNRYTIEHIKYPILLSP